MMTDPVRFFRLAVLPALLCVLGATASPAALSILDARTTDVSPSGFSVVWRTSEPASARIAVFADDQGAVEITTDLEVTRYPAYGGDPAVTDPYAARQAGEALQAKSAALGLTRLAVDGGAPETTYYFRVESENGAGEVAVWPQQGLATVTTARENGFVVEARQLRVTVTDPGGETTGCVVFASHPDAAAPISAVVGDGAGADQAYLDLSHFFGGDGTNLVLQGPQTVTLEVWGAPSGAVSQDLAVSYGGTFAVAAVDAAAVTVTPANRPPALAAVGAQTVAEGETLSFTVSATDPDGTTPTVTAAPLPTGATFDGASFSWTPGYSQAGSYSVTFTATDGSLTASAAVTITVTDTNRPPVLAAIGAKSGAEGQALTFSVSASDPDGTTPTVSAAPLPTGASFDGTSFSWTPGYDQAGSYTVTFTATDGSLTDSEAVAITVTNTNRPPVLAAVGAQTVAEGASLAFTVAADDPDGDPVTLSAQGLPNGASFDPGTGAFTWTPGYDAAGVYSITFGASDGSLTDSADVTVTVTDSNRPPTLAAVEDQTVAEGSALSFTVTASDPDPGDTLTVTTSGLPQGATFDGGTFAWTPAAGAAGAYSVTFTVTDQKSAQASRTVAITVTPAEPGAPVADAGTDQEVDEGTLVTLDGSASTDPNGDTLSYSWAQVGEPAVQITDAGKAKATFQAPEVGPAGATLTFQLTVSNGTATGSDLVSVTVRDVNLPPVADAGPDQTVSAGASVLLDGSNSRDPDSASLGSFVWVQTAGTAVTLADAQAPQATFTAPFPQGDGETLAFKLTVTDTAGVAASDTVRINVSRGNQPPVADAGTPVTVTPGAAVTLDGSRSFDPEGQPLAAYGWLQTAGPPVTLTGADTASPSFAAPGTGGVSLTFELTVVDAAGLSATAAVTVNVSAGNLPPVADAGQDQTVSPGDTVTLNGGNSTDPDGQIATYAWTLTSGPTVTVWDPDQAVATFKAPNDAPVSLTFTLTVTDTAGLTDTDAVTVRVVNAADQPPVARASAPAQVAEGDEVTLDGSGSADPEGAALTYRWQLLSGPAVVLADPTAPQATFTAPAVGPAGASMTFELTVTDGSGLPDHARVTVNVVDTNRPPVADAGGDQQVEEGTTVYLDAGSSVDPDGDPLTYRWECTSEPPVVLSSASAAQPTFVAPSVGPEGTTVTLRLTVQDPEGLEHSDTTAIGVVDNGLSDFPAEAVPVRTRTGTGLGLETAPGAALVAVEAGDPETLANQSGRPARLPYGYVDLELKTPTAGGTVVLDVYLPRTMTEDEQWMQYTDASGWTDLSSYTVYDGDGRKLTLTLTDGGPGDEDGAADGRIRFRSGLGGEALPADTDDGGGGGCFLRSLWR